MTDTLSPDLTEWVHAATGKRVVSSRPIGRGASRRIWSVAVDDGSPLVVREDTGTGPVAGTDLTLAREALVYRALGSTDLPIPTLHAVHPDGHALVLDHAPGVEHFKEADADDRTGVACDFGRCLGRLHRLDPTALDLGAISSTHSTSPTARDVALWRSIHDRRPSSASAAVPVALDWLASSVPPGQRVSLCHGDAGPGNFLHDGNEVTALLDWEFAHVGDPHDDLAWVAVRNQVQRNPIATIDVFRSWRDETGEDIDVPRLEWFRALVLTRMLVSCDASIAWAGESKDRPDADDAARVQIVLRPYLKLAVVEALRRAGCRSADLSDLELGARPGWEGSMIAGLLGDPIELDELGVLT